jgi:amino acid transporter
MVDNPNALMAISLGLILCCVIIIILFIIFVHTMPGKIAKRRGNPQAEAIDILSLLGLLIFPLWMAALVWAYIRPFTLPVEMVGKTHRPESEPMPEPVRDRAADPVDGTDPAAVDRDR